MVEVWLPYGSTEVPTRVPEENFLAVLDAKGVNPVANPLEEVRAALKNPFESRKLSELAGPDSSVVIVVDCDARFSPVPLMLQTILEELSNVGVKDERIKVIVACGALEAVKPEKFPELVGEDAVKRVVILNHDAKAEDNLVYVGDTSFGTKVSVNKQFYEADVKIVTGKVGFHGYAGYSGGRKSVFPGVAGLTSIKHNHALMIKPQAKPGVLEGNPVHLDMVEAAKLVKPIFTLNLVLGNGFEVLKAFAGDLERVFMESVRVVDSTYRVVLEEPVEVIITSAGGYPHDVDLAKAFKAVQNMEGIAEEGGVIVLVAECSEGYGRRKFYDWLVNLRTLEKVESSLRKSFEPGGENAYHLLKTLERNRVILVSMMPEHYATGVFKLRTAPTASSALETALRFVGKRKAKVAVVPYGSSTLPTLLRHQRTEMG